MKKSEKRKQQQTKKTVKIKFKKDVNQKIATNENNVTKITRSVFSTITTTCYGKKKLNF